MPQRRRAEITEDDIKGLKHFRKVRKLLRRLHFVGCERDRAGNRKLHFDEYCALILLHLFNPIVTSLKGLQQASELRNVQKRLGVGRAAMGSLSESVRVFDPTMLKEIATELQHRIPNKRPEEFASIQHTVTAVDGSVFDTIARVAELAWLPKAKGKTKYAYRLHTQFEVLRGTPARIDVTAANPKGADDERAVLGRTIESDRCYLLDRGYAKFQLWDAINAKGSSYVCRVRDNSVIETIEQRELTQADQDEGVLTDRVVQMGSKQQVDHRIRFITVAATPHTSRGRHKRSSTGPNCDGQIRLVTNMMDVPAELISKLYRLRWMIELFFRMFKSLLGVRHLLSSREEGVEIHAYMAIIACLLILIHTGRTPTKRTFEMICFYLSGWAELDELEAHIAKLKAVDSKTA